ncbi:MAG: hypothetical protein JXA93_07735 [Anaerolineae bacterium]|nr:hypothetical protein [Anaerolineae bacterium]
MAEETSRTGITPPMDRNRKARVEAAQHTNLSEAIRVLPAQRGTGGEERVRKIGAWGCFSF